MPSIRKQEQSRQTNRRYKTSIKNRIKKFKTFVKSNNTGELSKLVSEIQKYLDKAANKKIIHKNKAGRLKSKVQHLFHKKMYKTVDEE